MKLSVACLASDLPAHRPGGQARTPSAAEPRPGVARDAIHAPALFAPPRLDLEDDELPTTVSITALRSGARPRVGYAPPKDAVAAGVA